MVTASARLKELDLSDNAFGPIGVQGLASLLRSSSCYGLEELRLNNNGLGIGGGKLLSSALIDCYNTSKAQGKPLALKVFIAGRNRLENEGAKALAKFFKVSGCILQFWKAHQVSTVIKAPPHLRAFQDATCSIQFNSAMPERSAHNSCQVGEKILEIYRLLS